MSEKLNSIMLVDDDLITNFLHSRLIKKLNISSSIVVTENGEEALDYICQHDPPDVILLDLNMPVMNGFEFLKVFYKKYKNKVKTKVIVLSSSISRKDRSIASSYGVPFLTKPLSADELLNAL
ncbi:MAG TPA: response regulator [Cyclobacteriaceae bacterium]|nr:response regulator [Cyclobacteriaceae bacterium]